jgi:hypothetical protein
MHTNGVYDEIKSVNFFPEYVILFNFQNTKTCVWVWACMCVCGRGLHKVVISPVVYCCEI